MTGAKWLNISQTNFDLAVTFGSVPKAKVTMERLCGYDSAL
jgi:hypothetical protein